MAKRSKKIVVFQGASGKWRWRKVAGNGEIVCHSGQEYNRKSIAVKSALQEFDDCKRSILNNYIIIIED